MCILLAVCLPLACWFLAACGIDRSAQKKKAATMADLGQAMAAEGNARGGLQRLLEACKLDPENPDIYQQTALVFRSLGQYQLSLQYFRKALALREDFPEARNNMGTVYLLMGDWEKAISCFKAAAENIKYQTPHYAYNNMGVAHFNMGQYQKAIQNYERALRMSPSYAVAYVNLARVYEALKDMGQAEANYREAILYRPKDPEAHLGLAKLLLKKGDVKEAKSSLSIIIRSDPRSPEAKEARKLLTKIQG